MHSKWSGVIRCSLIQHPERIKEKGAETTFSAPFSMIRCAISHSPSALTSNFDSSYIYNKCRYAFGGVPSAFDTTASIWTKASLSKADTPTVLRAGTPLGKNVV